MKKNTINLIGDSVLDNFYWLNNKKDDLEYVLKTLDYDVNNYAVDESVLENITSGIVPSNNYVQERIVQNMKPYPTNEDGIVKSIELCKNKEAVGVVSIGGNDLRVNMKSLIFGVDSFMNSVLTPEYAQNFYVTIKKLKSLHSKLILVSIYVPFTTFSLMKYFIEPVFSKWRNFIYSICKVLDIPVLDLSRTFDHNNRTHYGSTEIEPSNLTNLVIADGIDNIIKNYKSCVYYKTDCVGEWKTEQYQ